MLKLPLRPLLLAGALFVAGAAHADIRVGIDVSTTGPAASIGIPSKNTVLMWPQTLGGQKAHYIILDDGTDPAAAVRNVRKLISEEKVDVIVGPNITPTAIAALDAVAEGETPMVALAASAARGWRGRMSERPSTFSPAASIQPVSSSRWRRPRCSARSDSSSQPSPPGSR